MPRVRQRSTNSRHSRLFPTPASATTPTIPPRPSRERLSAVSSTASSSARPTKRENPRARDRSSRLRSVPTPASSWTVAGALRVVLVRDRGAEERHNAVAGELVDEALEALNAVGEDAEEALHDVRPHFGVELLGQVHRALHVGEEDRHLLALALEGGARGEDLLGKVLGGVRARVGRCSLRLGCQGRSTLGAELRRRRWVGPACRAQAREGRGALRAELRPWGVLVPAGRTSDAWRARHLPGVYVGSTRAVNVALRSSRARDAALGGIRRGSGRSSSNRARATSRSSRSNRSTPTNRWPWYRVSRTRTDSNSPPSASVPYWCATARSPCFSAATW